MYSPKVPEQLIPRLYQLAKNRRIPMTRLVAQLIQLGLTHLERETSQERATEVKQRSVNTTTKGKTR